jgi:hypothetical protein
LEGMRTGRPPAHGLPREKREEENYDLVCLPLATDKRPMASRLEAYFGGFLETNVLHSGRMNSAVFNQTTITKEHFDQLRLFWLARRIPSGGINARSPKKGYCWSNLQENRGRRRW